MTCTLDHTSGEGIPEFLCRFCHPDMNRERGGEVRSDGSRQWQTGARNFLIPKGMSTEEGNAMLARRQKAKDQQREEALKNLLIKHKDEFYDKKLKAWLPNSAKGVS